MIDLKANFFDCVQGSPEWLKLRCGSVTSARVAAAQARLKRKSNGREAGQDSQARIDYKLEIIAERLTGIATDHYVSRWMEEGRKKEPLARTAYELETGHEAEQIGFILHPEINWCGCSPDSLIGTNGMAEYKCPRIKTHLEYLFADKIPEIYIPQMTLQLACDPERDYNDFVSHCPELPKKYRTFIKRLWRKDAQIAEMEKDVRDFNAEVEDLLAQLDELTGGESVIEHKLRQSIALVQNGKPQLVVNSLDQHLNVNERDWRR